MWTFIGVTILSVLVYLRHRTLERKFLRAAGGVVGVSTALDALDYRWDPSISIAASRSLKLLLPKFTPNDFETLERKHQKRLYEMLRERCAGEIHLDILRIVREVGDSEALWYVHWLGHDGHSKGIRAAAWECESALRKRLEAEAKTRSLLRPVDASSAAGFDSLRPAPESEALHSSLLLRPEVRGESEP